MNVSVIAGGFIPTAAPAREAASLDVRFDLISGFFLLAALVIGWLVYRWTASAPTAAVQTSKGERLMYAVVSASAIIVIGTYFGDGFGGIERVEKTTTGKPRAAAVTLLVVGDQDHEVTEDAVRSPERL